MITSTESPNGPQRLTRTLRLGKRLGVGLVIALLAILTVHLSRQSDWSAQLRVPGYRQKGPASAPVVMMEFSDYECPNCALAQVTVKQFLEKYPEKLRVVFRHFPLKMHKWSPIAAQAAEAAGAQGKFWEYSDKLFENQKEWATSDDAKVFFLEYAKALDLNIKKFRRDLDKGRWERLVQQDADEARARQVHSTPTFFINERRLAGDAQLKANGDRLIELAGQE